MARTVRGGVLGRSADAEGVQRRSLRLVLDPTMGRPIPKGLRGLSLSAWDMGLGQGPGLRALQKLGPLGGITFPDAMECSWYYWDSPSPGMLSPAGVVALADQLRVPRSAVTFTVNLFEFFQDDGADKKSHSSPPHPPVDGPQYAAAWVRENQRQRWGVRNWIIGCDEFKSRSRQQGLNPIDYGEAYIAYVRAMKKADPTIKIGMNLSTESEKWNGLLVKELGKITDFYAITHFPLPEKGWDESRLLSCAQRWNEKTKPALERTLAGSPEFPMVMAMAWNASDSAVLPALDGPSAACFTADTLGAFAGGLLHGAHFSAAAKRTADHDGGLLRGETLEPRGFYYGFRVWASAGPVLHHVEAPADLGAYLCSDKDRYSLVLVNRSEDDLVIETDLSRIPGTGAESVQGLRVGAVGPKERVGESRFTVLRAGPSLSWTLPRRCADCLDLTPVPNPA